MIVGIIPVEQDVPVPINEGDPAGGDLTGTYPNPSIDNAVITTDKIADGAITTIKLADGSVTAGKLDSFANLGIYPITSGDYISSGLLTDAHIDGFAGIATSKLAEGSKFITDTGFQKVSGIKIFTDPRLYSTYFPLWFQMVNKYYVDARVRSGLSLVTVGNNNLLPGSISGNVIAANSILQGHLSNNLIGVNQLINGVVSGNKIAANSILPGHLSIGVVSGNAIAANAILQGHLSNNLIGINQLQDASISGNKIAANSILSGHLAGDLTFNTSNIADGAISGNKIAANAILQGHLGNNIISTNQLQDGIVSGNKIAANSILPGHLSPMFKRVIKPTTQQKSLTTLLTEDVDLKFQIFTNEELWQFTFKLYVHISTTPEIKVGLNGPANPAFLSAYVLGLRQGVTTLAANAMIDDYVDSVSTSTAANQSGLITINGTIKTVQSGTLALTWAQSTSSATPIFLHRGSSLEAIRVL
jgi:hypothetical protein